MIWRVLRTGLSSLRDRAAARLAALRFNPSRWWRSFALRHHWLLVTAVFVGPFVALDRLTKFHSIAMFLTVCFVLQLADDRDKCA